MWVVAAMDEVQVRRNKLNGGIGNLIRNRTRRLDEVWNGPLANPPDELEVEFQGDKDYLRGLMNSQLDAFMSEDALQPLVRILHHQNMGEHGC